MKVQRAMDREFRLRKVIMEGGAGGGGEGDEVRKIQ